MFSQKGNSEMYEFEVADVDNQEKREATETVNRALMSLEPKFRIIVSMRMLQGYSTKETAEILGLPLGTILSRLSRAREQLKNVIEKL
jgi:RNA polymerase sigma-70 factor (ECF subfamily)